jgi:hypothetical protein
MFAVANMHTNAAKVLMDHGANVNATADDGTTALMLAASSGNRDIVQELLSRQADVSARFAASGKTSKMLAREKGYTEIVELLESAGERD